MKSFIQLFYRGYSLKFALMGVRPFYSKKYDLTRHPQYKYTADANPKYAFDVRAYLEHRLKVKPDEEYELYELGELPPETTG